jgi:peptidyl-prolyl cis-trans isomerase C
MKTGPFRCVARGAAALVALAGLLGVAAGATRAQPKPAAKAAPAAPSEADVKRRAQVLASYGGGQITVAAVEDAVAQQNPYMRRRYKDPKGLQELLERMLRFELMSDEALRRGFDKDAVVVAAVKQNAVQQLMKAEIDDKLPAESIPKPEIEKYYQDHLDEYVQPAMQRIGHVLVATEQEAKDLIAQAKSMDLRAFRELARSKSLEEATKLRGGDLGYADAQGKARGEPEVKVPLPIVKAAFGLKTIGDVAPRPVKIDGGYSVVKLTGQRPASSRSLADVQDAIRVRLWRERRQQAIETLVTKLRAELAPEVHPELVDAIKLDDGQPAGPSTPGPLPGHPAAQ